MGDRFYRVLLVVNDKLHGLQKTFNQCPHQFGTVGEVARLGTGRQFLEGAGWHADGEHGLVGAVGVGNLGFHGEKSGFGKMVIQVKRKLEGGARFLRPPLWSHTTTNDNRGIIIGYY